MKAKNLTRITSLVLAVVMVVLMLPIGTIGASALTEENFSKEPVKQLGVGFNAISGNNVSIGSLTPQSWIDYDKAHVYTFGDGENVLEQGGNAFYANNSLEVLNEFGIDYSRSAGANLSMGKAKAGLENKFSIGFDLSTKETYQELYYYYTYKAIYNRYVLKSDYSNYLSDEFLNAVKSIDPDSDLSIKAFFNTYGTHMLTGFESGGELQLSAWAISTSSEDKISVELENTVKMEAGYGDVVGASAAETIKLAFANTTTSNNFKSGVDFNAIGGSPIYVDTLDPSSFTLNKSNVEAWVQSLSPAFLPETSEWVSVWEALPQTDEYELIRTRLYEYFVENTEGSNAEFLATYCSFNNRILLTGYAYISPDGYVSQNVPYEISGINYVAPGATVAINKTIDDSIIPLDTISYTLNEEKSTAQAEIDRNGIFKVSRTANDGEKIVFNINSGVITIKQVEFIVKKEGENLFFGGYGTSSRPYLIKTTSDIVNLVTNTTLATDSSKHYMLVEDIDMTAVTNFTGIPNFSGVFDGNGHKIFGFAIENTSVTLGLFNRNTGTIKNLVVGNSDKNYSTMNDYSAKIYVDLSESKGHTASVGALVGINETSGIVDNCRVENVYIYGSLNDVNDNTTSYGRIGGVVGVSDGIISRTISEGNSIVCVMDIAGNSGDDTEADVGGICAEVGANGIVTYCISANNTMSATAYGDGTDAWNKPQNDSYPVALAGGLLAFTRSGAKVTAAVSYGNSIKCTACAAPGANYTKPTSHAGTLIGSQYGTVEGCYDWTPDSSYAAVGAGTTAGCIKLSSLDELNNMFTSNEHFTINNGFLVINPVNSIDISKLNDTYIVEDALNLLDLEVFGLTASGQKFKEYNQADKTYNTVNFDKFKIEGFSSEQSGNIFVTITTYAGKQKVVAMNVLPKSIEKIEIAQLPYTTSYYVGDSLDTLGLSVYKVYNTGEVEIVTGSQLNVLGFDSRKIGKQDLIVSLGEFTTSFNVTVYTVKPKEISINTLPNKTSYAIKDSFDSAGLTLLVTYNNGSTAIISENFVLSGFDSNSEGTKNITVEYTYVDTDINKQVTLATEFTVNVGTVVGVAVKQSPEKTTYYTSDGKLDTTGLVLEVTYSNGLVKTVTSGFSTPYGYDLNKVGAQDVMVSYSGIVTTFDIYVEAVILTDIEITHLPKTKYFVGDTFTTSGLCLKLKYNDGTTKEAWNGFTAMVSGCDEGDRPTFLSTGTSSVTIYYIEGSQRKSVEYEIGVSPVVLEKIELGQAPYKTIYKQNDMFVDTGMVVNAVFNNGTIERITDYTFTYDFASIGNTQVLVWYLGQSVTIDVVVVAPQKIVIAKLPDITEYQVGDHIDLTGLSVKAVHYDGTYSDISLEQCEVNVDQLETVGRTLVTITYDGLSADFYVSVKEYEIPDEAPQIVVDSRSITPESTIKLSVNLKNNPGIAGIVLTIKYDTDALMLDSVTNGSIMSTMTTGTNIVFNNNTNTSEDGVLVTLTFTVKENAELGDYVIDCLVRECSNTELESVAIASQSGMLSLINFVYGDADGNGVVNLNDSILIRTYLATYDYDTGESSTVVSAGADADGNGTVNLNDAVLLNTYLANYDYDTGSSSVILGPAA